MKSNRKFIAQDKAVSPVIGVILMVAITVVLAATVYVWASGFGANTTQPARSIAASKAGAPFSGVQNFTITSASGNLRYQDLQVSVNGVTQTLVSLTCTDVTATPGSGNIAVCGMSGTSYAAKTTGDLVQAGDVLHVVGTAGNTIRIVDAQANSVLATYTFG